VVSTLKHNSQTCASDTIIANCDETEFKFNINEIFNEINKWFHSNLSMLNYDKHFLQFLTKTDHEINMQVSFGNRKISTAQTLKILGRTIDTTVTWKHHIGELTSRLNKVCYAIRSIKPFMSLDVLRSTYFSYVHSIISYGIIFWGNSSHSEEIFKIQKKK
jgi:DNA-binding CsgD family transcriptional regulator